jgi:hypothetical protein
MMACMSRTVVLLDTPPGYSLEGCFLRSTVEKDWNGLLTFEQTDDNKGEEGGLPLPVRSLHFLHVLYARASACPVRRQGFLWKHTVECCIEALSYLDAVRREKGRLTG